MFGWFKSRKENSNDVEAVFQEISKFFRDESLQNSKMPPEFQNIILNTTLIQTYSRALSISILAPNGI